MFIDAGMTNFSFILPFVCFLVVTVYGYRIARA